MQRLDKPQRYRDPQVNKILKMGGGRGYGR